MPIAHLILVPLAWGKDKKPSTKQLTQSNRDLELLLLVKQSFGCGGVYPATKGELSRYMCQSVKGCYNNILPHFEPFSLQTHKVKNYQIRSEIIGNLNAGQPKTPEGMAKLLDLNLD
jgi:hypothetical protein